MQKLKDGSYPLVVAETVNSIAGFAHANTTKLLRTRMTLRNRWTEGSLKFYKANPKDDIKKINAITGSFSPYLPLQETGGKRLPKKGSKVPWPTLAARSGGKAERPVMRKYQSGTLGEGQFIGALSGGGRGVFERKTRGKKVTVKLIRSLTQSSIPVKATHWHTDGIKPYLKQGLIEEEFVRQAKIHLSGEG